MEERFDIEAKRTSTGRARGSDIASEPVRFSPVHTYTRTETVAPGRYEQRTVRQVLAYEGEDRKWFDSYDEARRVIVKYESCDGVDYGAPRCEVPYWDYEACDWKWPECTDASCQTHHGEPCDGEDCDGCPQCCSAEPSYREDFHSDG